jgi:hypothetical protein
MVYQNRLCGFLLQVPIATLTLPQKIVQESLSFSKPPPLGSPKSFHHDSKPTRI